MYLVENLSSAHKRKTTTALHPPESLNRLSVNHGSFNKDIKDRVTVSVIDMVTGENMKMTNLGA